VQRKKQGSTIKRTRLPITMPILANLCSLLLSFVFFYFNSIMLAAACVAALLCFLRFGEFTILNQFDPEYNLCLTDIQITD